MKLSFLFGASAQTMVRLAIQNKAKISIRYIPRFFGHLLMGIFNSILAIPDLFYRDKGFPENIVFIMGHYRCGTTHLLNLMSADKSFIPPSTYQTIFPNSFLATEKLLTPLLDKVGPGVRAMDNMAMRMDSPQEEEIAMAALGAPTPYLIAHFPETGLKYSSCLTFKDSDEKTIIEWKRKHLKFVRKLVKKNGKSAVILLKSPANTARIPLLLEMYPDAKFVHIHREPYKTIQSSIHLYNTWYNMANFQSIDGLRLRRNETVLETYEEINKRWIEDKVLIRSDRQISVSFKEVQQNPIDTIQKIYNQLGYHLNQELLKDYLGTIKTYKKNDYEPLSDDLINQINNRLGFVFEEFNYEQKSI
ncbi:sulfotransferase family protein [Crocinitomix catalasitica]|uniref:sulfotransferase family protein n=1 Tax=Crocinitomix catalasitica TaxID=184607 RepID=UPI0004844640|nr:sulfotransferase [Crocinitomix catalasitica]